MGWVVQPQRVPLFRCRSDRSGRATTFRPDRLEKSAPACSEVMTLTHKWLAFLDLVNKKRLAQESSIAFFHRFVVPREYANNLVAFDQDVASLFALGQ